MIYNLYDGIEEEIPGSGQGAEPGYDLNWHIAFAYVLTVGCFQD